MVTAAVATVILQGKCARAKGPRAGGKGNLKRRDLRGDFVEKIRYGFEAGIKR